MDESAFDGGAGAPFPADPKQLWDQWVFAGKLPNRAWVTQADLKSVTTMVQFAEEVAATMLVPLRDAIGDDDGAVTRFTPADVTGAHLVSPKKRARPHAGALPDAAHVSRALVPPHETATRLEDLEGVLRQLTSQLARCKTRLRDCEKRVREYAEAAPPAGGSDGAPASGSTSAPVVVAPSVGPALSSVARSGARGGVVDGVHSSLGVVLEKLDAAKAEVDQAKSKSTDAFTKTQSLREALQFSGAGGGWGDTHETFGGGGGGDAAAAPSDSPAAFRMNPVVRAEIAGLQDSINNPEGPIHAMAVRLIDTSRQLKRPRLQNLALPLHQLVTNSNVAAALKALVGVRAGIAARAVNAAATYLGQSRDDIAGKQLMVLEARAASTILQAIF